MATNDGTEVKSILDRAGVLIACVPWGNWVSILVHLGVHHGHVYIRLRRWNKHRKKRRWYPTGRYFVVPALHAEALAGALQAAARGEPLGDEPDWLDEFREEYAAYKARQGESQRSTDNN